MRIERSIFLRLRFVIGGNKASPQDPRVLSEARRSHHEHVECDDWLDTLELFMALVGCRSSGR